MIKRFLSIIVIFAITFTSCHKDQAEPSFESKILGNWLVVSSDYTASTTEWGFFYVSSVKLYKDKSFKLNLGTQPDDPTSLKPGTWELIKDKKSIVFYTVVNDMGTILRDTTEFKISLDSSNRLILENERTKIFHKKQNN